MAHINTEKAALLNDYIKHINNLSTGSIILLVTFLEKIFLKPEWKVLVGIALVSFLVSVIGGIVVKTINTIQTIRDIDIHSLNLQVQNAWVLGIVTLWASFLIGVSSIAIFGIKNLF